MGGQNFEERRIADREEHRTVGAEGRHSQVAEAVVRHTVAVAVVHSRPGVEERHIDQAVAVGTGLGAVQVSRIDWAAVLRSPVAHRVVLPTGLGLAGVEVHHKVVDGSAGEGHSFPGAAGHPNPVAEAARYTRTVPEAGAPDSILPG